MVYTKSIDMEPSSEGPSTVSGFFKSQFATPLTIPKDTDISGKTAIVTGANLGLGFEACRQLLALKLSHLILAVRSSKKGEDAATKLTAEYPEAKVEVWPVDMSSYKSIQAFTSRVDSSLRSLDIVILNAGIVKSDFSIVESTGHEETIQVNYLSTVLLTILLLPILKRKSAASAPGRLSIVGSGTAYVAKFPYRNEVPVLKPFDDASKWDPNERYWVSKLLGHYFLAKMSKMGYVDSKDVVLNIVDPGLTKSTGLNREGGIIVALIMGLMKMIAGRSLEVGASTYVDATVLKGRETHECYVMDWKIFPFAALLHAPDSTEVTNRLWDETMEELKSFQPLKILESMRK